MDMSREQATTLAHQVQSSHRLLAGFYRRVLPALDEIAVQFGAGFWFWNTIDFDRPCRSSTKPSSKWAWDFLPLLNSDFVYARTDVEQQAIIQLQLRTDPTVVKGSRPGGGQPNPVHLGEAAPVIRIYVYWLEDGSSADIKNEWEAAEYPKGDFLLVSQLTNDLRGTWWEIELADFMLAPQDLVLTITDFISLPAQID